MAHFEQARNAGDQWKVLIAEGVSLEFVWCPAGDFIMGSLQHQPFADFFEMPARKIRLTKGFWIGRTPLTNQQWQICMDLGDVFSKHVDDRPAAGMRWEQAVSYCTKLSELLRTKHIVTETEIIALPTEAQWEYACRAGTDTVWFFGNHENKLGDYAWYQANSGNKTQPVAGKLSNPWGIYDLYGNVSEWCADDMQSYGNITTAVDPVVRTNGELKIIRGGGYASRAANCRSAVRNTSLTYNPYNDPIGMRVVCINV